MGGYLWDDWRTTCEAIYCCSRLMHVVLVDKVLHLTQKVESHKHLELALVSVSRLAQRPSHRGQGLGKQGTPLFNDSVEQSWCE